MKSTTYIDIWLRAYLAALTGASANPLFSGSAELTQEFAKKCANFAVESYKKTATEEIPDVQQ